MASVLYIEPGDLGDEPRIDKAGILNDESPLEFYDFHALVEDEAAAAQLVDRTPAQYADRHPDGDPSYFDDRTGETVEDDADDKPDICQVILTSGDREGELCGRDRPCRFHD